MSELKKTYQEKLKSSALSAEDAKKLGFTLHEAANKLESHFFDAPAFKLPYHDAKGKPTGFYRIRYLGTTKKGFARATAAKDRRYDQPAAELPQLYLPKLLPGKARWTDIFSDPEVSLVFTEGELKAACAVKHGLPTIALGGVWNFKSKKNGLMRLPILEEIEWKGRTVYIVFDSDAATNPQVVHAQYKFVEQLFHLGATPLIVNIPPEEDRKLGIDDYIVTYGVKAFKQLITDSAHHFEFQFCKELLQLNGEVAIVQKPVSIIHFDTGQLMTKQDAAMLFANRRMLEQKLKAGKGEDADPSVEYKEAATFDKWLQWESRNQVYAPVYEPGKDRFIINGDAKRYYNTWNGWGVTPEKGDVSLWKWLLDQIFKNAEPEHRTWFEQWCSYPLQNPGVKLFTCPILFGQVKGTGKSLLGLSLMSIYGENGAEITDTQLEDERNVFMAQKQFILANEVTGSDRRTMVGRLRNLITQHSVVINKKYEPDYTVRDTINYFFTSNQIDAVYMENDERRFFVHEVLGPRLVDLDVKKVQAYDRWLRSGAAAKAIFYHLLQVDLTGFDPTAPAPDTVSKAKMVEASMTELESWAAKLKEDPDTCLRVGGAIVPYRLYRLKDIMALYGDDGQKRPYEKALAKALHKAGFKKAGNGNSCSTKDGKVNLWALRDDKDALLSAKAAGALYDNERMLGEKKLKFSKNSRRGAANKT